MKLSDPSRSLWLFLLHQGGQWTASEVARRNDISAAEAFQALTAMSRRNLVEKFEPAAGKFRLRYGVTGTCSVPSGFSVAEVQA